MRVLITGGAGLVGTPISQRFVELGWDVRVIGVDPTCDIAGVEYAQVDIRDMDALLPHVRDRDAIVHLAAIPSTRTRRNDALFDVNVAGTFNVFEAAERAGVKRIAQASSINAIGGYWGCDARAYDYFPLDEAQRLHTTDCYSFSKEMVEQIAAYFHRRAGIDSVSFRLPAVWNDAHVIRNRMHENQRWQLKSLARFIQLSAEEQREKLAKARQRANALRAKKPMELEGLRDGVLDREAPPDDWLFDSMFYGRFNFWTFIHTDDSTAAFELALTKDIKGAHPLFVNSDRNWLGADTEILLRLFWSETPRRTRKISGDESPVCIQRARELLGFKAKIRTLWDLRALQP